MRPQRSNSNRYRETESLLLHGTDDTESETEFDYDDAVTECGYGRFHFLLLFVCGWANASDAIEIICISFLLPSAECDLDLTAARKGWLSAILFIGMMIGGYVWGSLGDSIGRRSVLMNAMLVNAVAGIGSSFTQEFYSFLTFRFLSGVGVGGSIPVVWTYFAEFQPADKRGGALSFLASFWMIGNVTVAGLAWLVIPHELGWSSESFTYNSWRIFTLLSAVPSLLVAVSLQFLPESPKFLLSQGKHSEAIQILRNIYSQNSGKPGNDYRVNQIVMDAVSPHIVHDRKKSLVEEVMTAVKRALQLFTSKSLFRVTIIMIIINFAIQFGYYGLWLWFPELFNKLELYYTANPNSSITVCEVIESGKNLASNSTLNCDQNRVPPDNKVFINSFIISLSSAPSNLWTIFHMDKLGRKFFLVLSMLLSGGAAFLIYLVNSETMNLVLSCVFGAVSTMGFNSLDCLGIELFPTHLRGTAMAVTLVSARLGAILGNLVFGYLVETNCAIPILMVAFLLIGGGLMGIILPNTTKKPLM